MSKKRGPNSPMESEKTKQSTSSAAAATLGMAAMLSAVSNVFSGSEARSSVSVTDSEDEYSLATGGDNPWNSSNVSNSTIKQPKSSEELRPLFEYRHDGAMRDEIEVEILTKNGRKFTGSITPLEAKYDIYLKALNFENHDNFDGVRINYKGRLVVTFKLIEPINIDDLEAYENFEFKRTWLANGKQGEDTIGCKIKGIRYRPPTVSAFENSNQDDGTKVVKIEGCEYRVAEDEILAWLSLYGEVVSELKEDCFRDENQRTGNNRTGNYSIMMRLEKNIPQLLPMHGRRIKMYHSGIQKLCTHCFGPHKKQHCTVEVKVPWINYVKEFIEENDDVPVEFFGRWPELVAKTSYERASGTHRYDRNPQQPIQQEPAISEPVISEPHRANENNQLPNQQTPTTSNQSSNNNAPATQNPTAITIQVPTKEQFDIPTTEEAYERMVERLSTVGLARWEVDKAIEAKTTAFNRACREHKKHLTELKKKADPKQTMKTRKNSVN